MRQLRLTKHHVPSYDPATRAHVLGVAPSQRYILQNVITDPLWVPEVVFGARKNVQGFHTDVAGLWPLFQDLYLTK